MALHGLGLLRHQQGRWAEAQGLIAQAIALGLPGAAPHANLAAVRLAAGDAAGALAAAEAALARDPAHFGALYNLGLAAEESRDWPRARAALERALATRPGDAAATAALLRVLDRSGDVAAALALRGARHRDHPGDPQLALAWGRACHRAGRLAEALDALALAAAPADASDDALLQHAVAALDLGEVDASLRAYDRLLARRPDYAEADSNRLIALQHHPRMRSPSALHAGAPRLGAAPRARCLAAGAARGGWIVAAAPGLHVAAPARGAGRDLPRAAAAGTGPRALRGPALQRFSHVDAASARLRGLADGWCEAWRLDDAALVERLRADRIDVLFELSGHAPAHRLRALARRAAPVQVCWLDYFCTTGLAAIDWYYSDAGLSPEGGPQRYSERLLRLPAGRLCYLPPADAPPVAVRPPRPLRLGSFNRLSKLNDEVAAAWSHILAALPGSVLRLKAHGLDDPRTRAWVHAAALRPAWHRARAPRVRGPRQPRRGDGRRGTRSTWRWIRFRSPAARPPAMPCGWAYRS